MSGEKPQRRVWPRLKRHFLVRYRAVQEEDWGVSTLRDISCDGARLFCERAFPTYSRLLIEMGMPVFDRPVQVLAQVVWCKAKRSGTIGMAEHGVVFSGAADVRALIEAAIRRLMAEN